MPSEPGLPTGKLPPDLLRQLVLGHLGARRPETLVRAAVGVDCAAIALDDGEWACVLKTDPIPQVGIHHPTINRVTFEAVGQRTRMTFTAGPYPDEVFADSETGWNSIVSRLDDLLRG